MRPARRRDSPPGRRTIAPPTTNVAASATVIAALTTFRIIRLPPFRSIDRERTGPAVRPGPSRFRQCGSASDPEVGYPT